MIPSRTEQERVLELVRNAGDVILVYYNKRIADPNFDIDVQAKSDGSLVTEADFASNEIITKGLLQLFPHDAILSEEDQRSASIINSSRLWILDPLDGTQSFVNGNDDFSILLALCLSGDPVYGIMNFPVRKEVVVAVRGQGALINGRRLEVSSSSFIRPGSVYVRSFNMSRNELAFPEWMDSGCAMLTLCKGVFDGIIIRLLNHKEWDLAAPTAAIIESGGVVTDEHGNHMKFSGAPMSSRYFVASNGKIHEDLLKQIEEGENAKG